MKGLPTLIRVRTWELEEKRRKVADLQGLEAQLAEAIARLDDEVQLENQVVSSDTNASFTYGSYISAAIERRRTLDASVEDVRRQIEAAQEDVTIAYQELKKFEVAQSNRKRRARDEAGRREQVVLDEIGLETYRRRG
jgi:flagellar export protein FliJ